MRYLCLLLLVLVSTSQVEAWHTNTHLQMTRDAIHLLPEEFQNLFKQNRKFVEAGITDPDEITKDWQNHYFIPGNPPDGGALDRIDKIVKAIEIKFKNSSTTDVSKQLCYLAHYVGDLWSPEAMIKKSTMLDKDFITNTGLFVLYEGYDAPIENIRDYLQKRAEWRRKLENSKDVSPLLYSEAVNDIVRVWLTLWQRSGKTVEPQQALSLEHPKGALHINFQQLLKEAFLEQQDAEVKHYYSSGEAKVEAKAQLDAAKLETERLKETVAPTREALVASSEVRTRQNMLSLMSPKPEFYVLDCSLRTVGDKSFLVTRIVNNGEADIPGVAFMYPGVKGRVVMAQGLKSGQAVKLEGELPANASKQKIEIVFGTTE